MKRISFFLVISATFLLCQGCTPRSSVSIKHSNAKLVDLGNGICRQYTGLMWQVERSKVFTSSQEALAYVHGLTIGGYDGWRLPSKNELYDLCVLFELRQGGDCPIKVKGSYWLHNGITQAGEWEAYPMCGGSEFEYFKSHKGRVLAVRPE